MLKKSGLMLLLIAALAGCKKDENDDAKLDSNVEQFNDDASLYNAESDQIQNDLNVIVQDETEFGRVGKSAGITSDLCGITIDKSQIAQKTLLFIFDGVTPCLSPSRTRAGKVKVQLTSGTSWSNPNAVLTYTFINFKVVRLKDNQSVTLNGTKTVKNVNGSNWLSFLSGAATIKYQERSLNLQATFNGGSAANWNVARVTEWSYRPSDQRITFKANGDSTLGGIANVDSWGTNRFGTPFTTYYTKSLLSNTYCGLWRPNSGTLVHSINNDLFTLTLGTDQQGNPINLDCAYGYKVTWVGANGNTLSVVESY